MLADSWEWTDEIHLHIVLKDYATFSDGSEITSEDVLWSLQRIVDESAPCVQLAQWIDFENCSIESDTEFTIATYNAFPAAVYMLSAHTWANILSKDFAESATADDWWSNPVASGPYTVVSNTEGVDAVYQLNEDYWNIDNLQTDAKQITLKFYSSNQTMMLDYTEGNLDMVINADTS